jgi:GTPase SAR1 family protein
MCGKSLTAAQVGYDPTVEDEWTKELSIDGEKQIVEFTDTGGDDEFRHTLTRHARENDGFILVYSVDKRDSFYALERDFLDTIRMNAPGGFARLPPIVLVANKVDQKAKITSQQGQALAQRLSATFYEASCRLDGMPGQPAVVASIFHDACRQARLELRPPRVVPACAQLTSRDASVW